MLVFPERAQERNIPAGDAVSVLSQDKSPVAIRAVAEARRPCVSATEDVAMMAHSQGREVMVMQPTVAVASFCQKARIWQDM
ncbi:hypothetical protein [Salmonella enterica]|uniref:hypothetical protein n=1 Tax=Salmonella enterica TaxID=28901 RepID=UPI001C379EE1|nr:hypothetical protein [Salmonella enterica]